MTISDTPIVDISPLTSNDALVGLDISRTAVSDISPLSAMASLSWVAMSEIDIASLAGISGAGVRKLTLADGTLSSLDGLIELPNLRVLSVPGNRLTSLQTMDDLGPALLDARDNPLDESADVVAQSLCDRGWAVATDRVSCGDHCLFDNCTL